MRGLLGLLLAGLLVGPPQVRATEQGTDPQEQLARMESALRTLDYEGTLVRLADNRLETLHLVHRILGGRVHERLVSLSGPVRAVTRGGGELTCVMPDGHPMSVKSRAGGHLLRPHAVDVSALAPHYRVEADGMGRVAGRDTHVIRLEPRDDLRYGFRFHIDRDTGLPLKSDLLDGDGEPLEQLMFTALTLGPAQDDRAQGEGPAPEASEPSPAAELELLGVRWSFRERPAGFRLDMHDQLTAPDGAAVVTCRLLRPALRLLVVHRIGGRSGAGRRDPSRGGTCRWAQARGLSDHRGWRGARADRGDGGDGGASRRYRE